MKDPEPQVIAEAIAAFGMNNMTRERKLNLQPRDAITFPALTMVGSLLQSYSSYSNCCTQQSGSNRDFSRERNPCSLYTYSPSQK